MTGFVLKRGVGLKLNSFSPSRSFATGVRVNLTGVGVKIMSDQLDLFVPDRGHSCELKKRAVFVHHFRGGSVTICRTCRTVIRKRGIATAMDEFQLREIADLLAPKVQRGNDETGGPNGQEESIA